MANATDVAIANGVKPRSSTYGSLDRILLVCILTLLSLGIVMSYSSSAMYSYSQTRGLSTISFFWRFGMFSSIGLGLMWFLSYIDYRWLRKMIYPLLLLTLVLLLFVLLKGRRLNGATRWIFLFGFTFQPGELAKLTLCIYLAHLFARKSEKAGEIISELTGALIITGIISALILKQPDLGTVIVLVVIAVTLMFVAGAPILYLVIFALATTPVVYLLMVVPEFRRKRVIDYFVNTLSNVFNKSIKHVTGANLDFQMQHSLASFSSGGVFGWGIGQGREKLLLPEANTDYVLAVIGQELGFVGVAIIMGLFVVLVVRGLQISYRAPDLFGKFLALGITTWFACQTVINMAVVMALIPAKGLTLPFISYGGTSLMLNFAAMGILLNISRRLPETAVSVGFKGIWPFNRSKNRRKTREKAVFVNA